MKTLYLMRHGEALFNRRHRIQGWCDSPLTERGRDQARADEPADGTGAGPWRLVDVIRLAR